MLEDACLLFGLVVHSWATLCYVFPRDQQLQSFPGLPLRSGAFSSSFACFFCERGNHRSVLAKTVTRCRFSSHGLVGVTRYSRCFLLSREPVNMFASPCCFPSTSSLDRTSTRTETHIAVPPGAWRADMKRTTSNNAPSSHAWEMKALAESWPRFMLRV